MNYKCFKKKPILTLLLISRIIVIIACISLIGTRFLVGVYINSPKNMLIESVKAGDGAVVRELLQQGNKIDVFDMPDGEFTTPLFLSAINVPYGDQYISIMKMLIDFYEKTNDRNWRGESALHATVMIENFDTLLEVFTILFLHGVNLDLKNREGNTVLEEFVRCNYRGAIEILLQNYADIFGMHRLDAMIKKSQEYMFTDLEEIVVKYKELLDMHQFIPANIGIFDEQLRCILRGNYQKLEQEPIKQVFDIFGNNQLHYAILSNNIALCELLLKKEINLAHLKNRAGAQPLHLMCIGDGSIEFQKNLLMLFSAYKINLNQQDGTGSTIMHILIRKRNFELIRFIMQNFKNSIDLSIKDGINGETPRQLLARLDKSVVSILY